MDDDVESIYDIQVIDGNLIINDTSIDDRSSISLKMPIKELNEDKYLVIELVDIYGIEILDCCCNELLEDEEVLKAVKKKINENKYSYVKERK